MITMTMIIITMVIITMVTMTMVTMNTMIIVILSIIMTSGWIDAKVLTENLLSLTESERSLLCPCALHRIVDSTNLKSLFDTIRQSSTGLRTMLIQ